MRNSPRSTGMVCFELPRTDFAFTQAWQLAPEDHAWRQSPGLPAFNGVGSSHSTSSGPGAGSMSKPEDKSAGDRDEHASVRSNKTDRSLVHCLHPLQNLKDALLGELNKELEKARV